MARAWLCQSKLGWSESFALRRGPGSLSMIRNLYCRLQWRGDWIAVDPTAPCSERLNGSGPERPQPAAFTARPGAGRCSESWSCRNRRSRRRVGPGPAGAGPCPGPAQAGTMVRDLRLRHGHGDAHAQELAESGRALPPRQGRSWSRHQDGRQQDSESEPAGAAGHSQATATIVLVPCRRIAAMLQDGPPGPLDRTLAIGFGPRPA